jgi:hypothetical protein
MHVETSSEVSQNGRKSKMHAIGPITAHSLTAVLDLDEHLFIIQYAYLDIFESHLTKSLEETRVNN